MLLTRNVCTQANSILNTFILQVIDQCPTGVLFGGSSASQSQPHS